MPKEGINKTVLLVVNTDGSFNSQQYVPLKTFQDNGDSLSPIISGLLIVGNRNFLFNGSGWDRYRNNINSTFLSSGARTVETFSADFNNFNHKGILVFLNITVVTVATTLTLTLQMKDNISGNYFDLQSGTAFNGVGQYVTEYYPGVVELLSASQDKFNRTVPRIFRFKITPSDANSVTYSLGGSLIL